jgi:2-dehydro-3-deoxygluconokinase
VSMDVLAIGEPLLEFNAATGGGLEAAENFAVGYGGDTSNFLVAATRAGSSTGYLTRIGTDPFGTALVGLWKREGIDTRHVIREEGGATGIYFISRGPAGHAFTYYREGSPASRLAPADVPEDAVVQARLLHVSGITQAISASACDAAFHAMAVARANGTFISYDPNHRPALWPTERARAVVMRSVELCDVALPNLVEGRLLTDRTDARDVLAAFVERGPRTVALKMGADGALLAHDGQVTHIAPHPVTEVDASGAGDTFDGYFLTLLLEGVPPIDAARHAAVAAAISATGYGAVRPIPRRADVQRLVATSDEVGTPTSVQLA